MTPTPQFVYNATIIRWIDGDTVDVVADLGFNVKMEMRLRLLGINTPERGQPGYQEATDFNKKNCPEQIVIESHKQEKYGRYLATIYIPDSDKTLNDMLVENHLAVPYFGGPR